MAELAIELTGVNKYFGEVHANKNISFAVAKGSIHGIIGENGAGKSTLMSILYGYYQADSGSIRLNGEGCGGRAEAGFGGGIMARIQFEVSLPDRDRSPCRFKDCSAPVPERHQFKRWIRGRTRRAGARRRGFRCIRRRGWPVRGHG